MFVLRNRFLNTSAVLSLPDNEGGNTPLTAEQERELIKVESVGNKKDDKDVNDNDDTDDDNEENEDIEEKSDNENGENEEEIEETDEQKTERLAKEKEERKAKEARKEERRQRKWNKLAAERDEALNEAERLRKQIAENNPDGLSEEEVERRAEEKANKKLQDKEAERIQREFGKSVRELDIAAKKADPKFETKLNDMLSELDRLVPGNVISILSDLDNKNGGDVLNYLTDNVDEADDIFDLAEDIKTYHKMAQKLIRISDKLKETKKNKNGNKPERKPPPPPLNTVREGSKIESSVLTGKESMDDFVRIRERQSEQHRKNKGGW